MSDTVKLIIEIPKTPKNDHERWALAHGIPLDDVKAEIRKLKYFPATLEHELHYNAGLIATIDILDNIGKAESEGK